MEEDNLVADITDSLYFCSQASSLISPVMKLPMPPLPMVPGLPESMNDEFIATKCSTPWPLPTISDLPTVYIGSRSSNFYSPVTEITRLSSLDHEYSWSMSLVCLSILMAAAVATLAAWMFLSLPFLSYIMASSVCETLTLSPIILLNSLKIKVRDVYQFSV